MLLRLIVLLFIFISLCGFTLAGFTNITFQDDAESDNGTAAITYAPPSMWKQTQGLNETWHESVVGPNSSVGAPTATFPFTGSAVYVYCILEPQTESHMTFFLDGGQVESTTAPSVSSHERQIVFSKTGLSEGPHVLLIQNNSTSSSTISLDSIDVTIEDNSSSSSQPQVGVIIGAVLGSLAVIPLCGLGYLLYIRRRQNPENAADVESPPDNTRQQTCRWKLTLPSILRFNPVNLAQPAQPVRTHRAAGSFQIDNSSRGGPPNPAPASPWFVDPNQRLNRVQIWQQQTHEATRDQEMAPPDMSEELSSYYDDNATESQRYRPGTPPPPQRRFVIRNN
ncbi:hypothetical protein VKT23_002952 [Stygiomarasmius scandens]|uniref:Transmembrane protein n=1 Tax=Marasmiellus scandens TaxID=2682957 RepID=A0ABR1K1F7_9AGAR